MQKQHFQLSVFFIEKASGLFIVFFLFVQCTDHLSKIKIYKPDHLRENIFVIYITSKIVPFFECKKNYSKIFKTFTERSHQMLDLPWFILLKYETANYKLSEKVTWLGYYYLRYQRRVYKLIIWVKRNMFWDYRTVKF